MQINLPEDTVARCKACMNKKETWAAFIERILDENESMSSRISGEGLISESELKVFRDGN